MHVTRHSQRKQLIWSFSLWLIKKADFKIMKVISIMMMVIYDCNGNSGANDVKDYGDNDVNNS